MNKNKYSMNIRNNRKRAIKKLIKYCNIIILIKPMFNKNMKLIILWMKVIHIALLLPIKITF